jgi:hypothetical protein
VEQVDSFCVMVWVIMAKVVVKEMHRLSLAGDIRGELPNIPARVPLQVLMG